MHVEGYISNLIRNKLGGWIPGFMTIKKQRNGNQIGRKILSLDAVRNNPIHIIDNFLFR